MDARRGAEAGHIGRAIRWGIAGLFLLVAAAIVVSIVFRVLSPSSSGATSRGFFTPWFFPFGVFLLFIFFFASQSWLRPWRWGWGHAGPYWHHSPEATEILRQRYARGDLTREQFEQMSRDLERTGGSP